MRPLITLLIILFLVLALQSGAFAFQTGKPAAPYGDYCSRISKYGAHKLMHNHSKAEHAIKHYFHQKGLDIDIIEIKGRFMKANVSRDGKVVDIILFDRKTGRIRSIY